jgi:cytochrome c
VGNRRIALDIGNLKGHALLDGLTGAGLTDANMTAFELCNYGLVEAERSANCTKTEQCETRGRFSFPVSPYCLSVRWCTKVWRNQVPSSPSRTLALGHFTVPNGLGLTVANQLPDCKVALVLTARAIWPLARGADILVGALPMRRVVLVLVFFFTNAAHQEANASEMEAKTAAPIMKIVEVGDAGQGLAYAEKTCAGCHSVLRTGAASPNKDAPPFEQIANTPGMSITALTVWSRTSHPTMPNFVIPANDMDNLIAYIMSLRDR